LTINLDRKGRDTTAESVYDEDADRIIGGLDQLSVHETASKNAPLPDPATYIRLLRFLPGTNGSHLEFELTTWKHDEAPDYTAISYVWGNPDWSHYIVVDDSPFAVTSNCRYTLWQISQDQTSGPSTELYYWIDSICIDQSNLTEKGAQVQKMGDIYEQAHEVLSSVGPHAQDSELVLEVMKMDNVHRALLDLIDKVKGDYSKDEHKRCRTKALSAVMVGVQREWMKHNRPGDLPSFNKRFTDAIEAFSERTYWRRLWIVQEVQVAKNVRVLCGRSVINLTLLAAYLGCSSHHPGGGSQSLLKNLSFMGVALSLSGLVPKFKVNQASFAASDLDRMLDPGSIFTAFARFECTNFRDRLYALLRLITWAKGEGRIVPDYALTKFGLTTQLAKVLAHWTATSDVLQHLSTARSASSSSRPIEVMQAVSSFRKALRLDRSDQELADLTDKRLADNGEAWRSAIAGATWYIDDESESVFSNGSLYFDYMMSVSRDGMEWCALREVEGGIEYVGDVLVAPVNYVREKMHAADSAITGPLALFCQRLTGARGKGHSWDSSKVNTDLEDWIIVSMFVKEWYKYRRAYFLEIYKSGMKVDRVTITPSANQEAHERENISAAANVDVW
jgi:hypothetical protein